MVLNQRLGAAAVAALMSASAVAQIPTVAPSGDTSLTPDRPAPTPQG